ncbi:MAG TPA: hypothetical protein VFA19_04780 [Gaiellaceae bacterium]|nr:hypothetical protein [Gaiellaceae bacterium]
MSRPAPTPTFKPLPLEDRRAVGGPVSTSLLGAYFAVALLAWIAAAATAVAAAPALAAGNPFAPDVLLAVHLVALGTLPFAVAGASFHLLPVMLRNDLPSQRALWLALPLLGGGFAVAAGVAHDVPAAVWAGAAALSAGLAIVLAEILTLVVRAPRGRTLVASRVGVGLSCAHAVAALVLGAALFHGSLAGRAYLHALLIHLHVALLGWIALLILAVGRTLAPMLAMAPAAPARSRPWEELGLVCGLWLLVGGIASGQRAATVAGGAVALVAVGWFVALALRTARLRRGPLEAPLAHVLAGGLLLVQAAAFGLAAAAGAGGPRLAIAYVILLLGGWAAGVVVGHVGKLLSLSFWVWWPPGPRPKQAELYPRRIGLAAASAFAAGVETLALATLAGSPVAARAGAAAVCLSAVLSVVGAAATWRYGRLRG